MKTRFLSVAVLVVAAACAQRPSPATATEDKDAKTPVAKFGDSTVTAGELDEMVKGDLSRMDQQYQQQRYQLRKEALEAMVSQKLVEARAKAQNLTPQELLKKEVMDTIPEPSDAEVKALYDQAKAGGQQLPPFDQVKPQIVAYLKNQKLQPAMAAYAEKLKKEANAQILLPEYEPPRVDVEAKGPSKGPASAKVTIVEFSDFQCPYCVRAEATVKEVLATYGDKVRLVYRDYPLPNHPLAPKAAEAAHCADEQGKYWDMHERLFSTGKLEVADLKQHAKDLGLDAAKFDQCLDSGTKAAIVEANKAAGSKAGVNGTPAFFINGRLLSGAQPMSEFKKVIDKELSRS
jgi:protein-disulfide isomerase